MLFSVFLRCSQLVVLLRATTSARISSPKSERTAPKIFLLHETPVLFLCFLTSTPTYSSKYLYIFRIIVKASTARLSYLCVREFSPSPPPTQMPSYISKRLTRVKQNEPPDFSSSEAESFLLFPLRKDLTLSLHRPDTCQKCCSHEEGTCKQIS